MNALLQPIAAYQLTLTNFRLAADCVGRIDNRVALGVQTANRGLDIVEGSVPESVLPDNALKKAWSYMV